MNQYLKISLLLLLVLMTHEGKSQNASADSSDSNKQAITTTPVYKPVIRKKRPKPITKEISFGGGLKTDGWGILANKGWVVTDDERNSDRFYNMRFVQFDFSEHKHVKEVKGTNTSVAGGTPGGKNKPFIFGKINNFYTLDLSYGIRKMIAGKPESGTISIHWVYSGGLSIGLLKPYYIDAYILKNGAKEYVPETIKYTDETREAFIKQENIIGSAGWTKGINETKIVPGVIAKTGLHFDFAATKKSKMALEVGVSGALYSKKIELMAGQTAYPYLLNAYLTLQFGKRY